MATEKSKSEFVASCTYFHGNSKILNHLVYIYSKKMDFKKRALGDGFGSSMILTAGSYTANDGGELTMTSMIVFLCQKLNLFERYTFHYLNMQQLKSVELDSRGIDVREI